MAQIAVGVVGKPHGLKGWVWVHSLSGETAHFREMGDVVLRRRRSRPDGQRHERRQATKHVAAGAVQEKHTRIQDVEERPNGLLVKFAVAQTIEDAEELRGFEIWADRSKAAPLAEEEYYIRDLVGCDVHVAGEFRGTVVAVWDNGVSDMLEVELATDGRTCNVPFLRRFVDDVDLGKGRIRISDEEILS
jgi:16S rRNA processing protein RimM